MSVKKFVFCVIAFIYVLCLSVYVFCDSDDIIKVGLNSKFNNISSVGISNSSIKIGIMKDGEFYGSDSISGNNFSIKTGKDYYIASKKSFGTFKEAKKNSGEKGIPVLIDKNCWKIYFGGYGSESDAVKSKNEFSDNEEIVKSKGNVMALFDGSTVSVIVDSGEYCTYIKDGGNGNIFINGNEYRNGIEFVKNGNYFNAVNVLSIDEYLYGTLPSEMDYSWHNEALKAQAVASRSFAVYSKNGKHSNDYYDLCDTSHCQVYNGVDVEKTETNSAVDETKNILAYYDGKVIEAVYFSSSGGSTADAKDVWNVEIPYLKAVSDSYENDAEVWTRVFSFSEMTKIVAENGEDIGNVKKVYIDSKDSFGRVNSLIIEGDKGNITLESEKIRTFFSNSKDGSLLSRNFSMDFDNIIQNIVNSKKTYIIGNNNESQVEFAEIKTIDNKENMYDFSRLEKIFVMGFDESKVYIKDNKDEYSQKFSNELIQGDIVFYGKGAGHGVGMSQTGAKSLAEIGKSYIDILKYYYNGIEIKKGFYNE